MEVHLRYLLDTLKCSPFCEKVVAVSKSDKYITLRVGNDPHVCFFSDFKKLAKQLEHLQADALFFNDGHWIEYFYELRKNFPFAVFIMRSGGNEFVKAPYHNMKLSLAERQSLWRKAINDNIDFIIANSTYTWQRMIQVGIQQSKILIVRGGVDLIAAKKNVAEKNLRQDFDKIFGTSNRYIFCIASRHVRFKGIAEILKIFNELKFSHKWFLLIAGSGTESAGLWQYCAENFTADSFAFLGAVNHEELMRYMALSDCLLCSSVDTLLPSGDDVYIHTETMSRCIIEAVCHRTPVIAAKAGGVHEWFEEIPGIGVLLPNESDKRKEIIQRSFEDGLIYSATKDLSIYGWEHIIKFFYRGLFQQRQKFFKTILCFDLEGSVVHPFFTPEENVFLLEKIFSFVSKDCGLVINSAGDFYEIIHRYPIIDKNLDRMIIIANGGEVIVNHGQRDILWQKYHDMQSEISPQEIAIVENVIHKAGLSLIRKRRVDKLYINFKVSGEIDNIVRTTLHLNNSLSNPSRLAVNNSHNIKLISKIINKGSALAYLMNFQLKCQRAIGVGNDILDKLFLPQCDKAFIVNPQEPASNAVHIKNFHDAKNFVNQLYSEVL